MARCVEFRRREASWRNLREACRCAEACRQIRRTACRFPDTLCEAATTLGQAGSLRRSGGVALQVKLPRARLVRDNLHGAIIRPLHARDFAASAATRQKPCTGHPFSFGRSCALDQCRQAWSYLTTRHRRHRLVRSERSIGPGLTGGPDEPCQLRYAPIIFSGHETCITPRARSDRARLRHERVRRGQQAATREHQTGESSSAPMAYHCRPSHGGSQAASPTSGETSTKRMFKPVRSSDDLARSGG